MNQKDEKLNPAKTPESSELSASDLEQVAGGSSAQAGETKHKDKVDIFIKDATLKQM